MANTKGSSVISNPKGGGAQSGLGEKFSPDLFTGTGNFSIPIAVPPGRNGFQPELSLGYSSGNGNSIFGLGWALGIPGVTRKTSKGIPVYEDQSDIFILSGAEDLVPVNITQTVSSGIGWEQTTYRPRTEGLFARIIRHKKTNGEHYWEVRSKDGLVSYYGTVGATGASSASAPAANEDGTVIANPEIRESIFAWHLSKTEDPFGNEIVYEYERNLVLPDPANAGLEGNKGRSYDQLYISKIKYCQYTTGTAPNLVKKYLCEVRFIYEERPDPNSSYKQGFEVRTTKRCVAIETYTNAASLIKTKTYHFKYKSKLPLNGASMLESVSVEGHNGTESEFMPPLEFSYSDYTPTKRDLKEISGPIPIMSLADPGFELVDLNGNGLPDLLQLNGTTRYWTNKGNGQFSQPRNLNISPSVQLGMPGVQMIDANGDGRSDLMVNNGTMAGYFPGAFDSVWDANSFRPYKQIPSFSFADPEVHLIDLDGDGITDVLRNGKRFECFYNDPDKGFSKVKTADKKFIDFSFSDPRIRFADMTGDGLQDIVLISSGRVQYWPNMGYGRFGNKINMKNAPVYPEQYNPAQILLGDLDGDGQADIAFVENNRVTLYVNQSGNGFSEPVTINNTPRVENPKSLRLIDMMGTGQAGILWSLLSGGATNGRLFFLDFTHGNKPYVLEQMNNNVGSLTRVAYGSSAHHYLRDNKKPETRWKTNLPFPVQVVNRVEVHDLLSGGKLVTEYQYHNGYWDGVEREFRGFAHVDSYDTESFERFNLQDLFSNTAPFSASTSLSGTFTPNTVSAEHYSPPTLTKSWFYVGPVGDGFSRWKEPDFTNEFWSDDQQMLKRTDDMKSLLAALPRRARRDALRTLRGSLLRSELYALDNSALKDRPYTVTESLMSLRMEFDPSQLPDPYWNEKNAYWSGGGYIFFPFNVAQRTTQYERGIDPMYSFSFTKEYDQYGQAQGQLSVGVPRGVNPLYGGVGSYLATYALAEYIYKDLIGYQYIVNRVKRTLSYDATKSAALNVFALRDWAFNPVSNALPVIGCTLSYYDWDGTNSTLFKGLPYGQIGDYGAQIRTETLIIDTTTITAAYSPNIPECFSTGPNWNGASYSTDFVNSMQDNTGHLGYKDRTNSTSYPYHVPGWYAESARVLYDFQVTSPPLPLYEQLGRVLQSRDVFDAWQEIEYDSYCVMPVKSTQYLYPFGGSGNSLYTMAAYDYRVMQPYQVTDPNENVSEFDFSPLGLLVATAIIGKSLTSSAEGDYKASTGDFYTRNEPSVRMEYDFFAFKTSGDPVWVKTISREKHYVDSATSDTITKVEYSDGFGRLLQTRVQAEDVIFTSTSLSGQVLGDSGLPADQSAANAPAVGTQRGSSDPLNVVVSGWQIYNNKGKVVEQYEPFFDKGFDYVLPGASTGSATGAGVKIKMFYDALGRVNRTVNPDGTEQWVFFGKPDNLSAPPNLKTGDGGTMLHTPWESYIYDGNDLASLANGGNNPVLSKHWFTPKSSLIDALGRTIKTTEHIDKTNTPPVNDVEMQYVYDIRGNLMQVLDPYMRTVFAHVYDFRPPQKGEDGKAQPLPALKTIHIDKGISGILFDATGKPVESSDAKGARALSAYDVTSRPIYAWAKNDSSDIFRLRQLMNYGDSVGSNPAANNLMGQLYQHYDEAGKTQLNSYDFKGNLLSKRRSVVDMKVLTTELDNYNSYFIDWTGVPNILDNSLYFDTEMEYDALNRATKLTLPNDVNNQRKDITPSYNRAGALEKVTYDGTDYVSNIAYNAKGQRLMIAFGNGVMTRYAYDGQNYRLLRQRSEKYTKTSNGNIITYAYNSGTNKQDDGFNYDFVGNILKILNRVNDCGITGSSLGSNALDREFDYDPLNRLTFADGRESTTQSGNSYLYDDAPVVGNPNANNVRYYSRTYTYDKLGNVLSVVQGGTNGFTRNFNYNSGVNSLYDVRDNSNVLLEDFTYDANGNQLTAGSTRNYRWNHADQLYCYYNQAGSADPTVFTQYDYDAGGKRLSKLVRTGTATAPIYERTLYIDGIFEYVKLNDGTTVYEKNYVHIMDDKSRIAEFRIDGSTGSFPGDITDKITYNLESNIGSSVLRLDTSGTKIDGEEYYPFGDSSLRTFTYKRYRYVGKERDAESGLYYYGARYYAAWTCRFISVDPLAGDYMYLTPYNYANNNPVDDYDIDGMQDHNTKKDSDNNTQKKTDNSAKTKGNKDRKEQSNNINALAKVLSSKYKGLSGDSNIKGTLIGEKKINFATGKSASKKSPIYEPKKNTSVNPSGNAVKKVEESGDAYVDLTEKVKWRSQYDTLVPTDSRSYRGPGPAGCCNACFYIIEQSGVKLTGGGIQYASIVDKVYTLTSDAPKAVNYIKSELLKGHVVMVGVDTRAGSGNNDNITDHWVLIVGMGKDEINGQAYFRFYDVAAKEDKKSDGANPENKFQLNSDTVWVGASRADKRYQYKLANIRTNK